MRDLLARLSWPQVAALCAIIGGTVAFLVLVPPHTLDTIAAWNWGAIVSGTVAVIGALGGAVGGPLVKPREQSPFPSLPPMSMPPPSIMPPELPGTPTNPGKPSLMPRDRGEED